jgi:signal transduction histidine kinase
MIESIIACSISSAITCAIAYYSFIRYSRIPTLNNAIDAYITFNRKKNNLYFSPKLASWLQLTNDTLTVNELHTALIEANYTNISHILNSLRDSLMDQPQEFITLCFNRHNRHFKYNIYVLSKLKIMFILHDVTSIANLCTEHLENKEKINNEFNLISSALDKLDIPLWIRNQEAAVIYSNKAYKEFSKHNSPFESGKHPKQLTIHNYDSQITHTQQKYVTIGGARYMFNISETVINNRYFLGVALDITEREQIKKNFEQHISAQSELLEISGSATAIYGADTKLKFFNQAFVRLWKLDEKWLASQPTYGQILEKLREGNTLQEYANFPEYKKNQLRLFNELIEPLNDFLYLPDGKALRVIVLPHASGGLLFSYEDMTDRLELERSYNTLMAVQKATLDNLDQAVFVVGADGRVKLTNPAYHILFKVSEEFLAKSPHIIELLEIVKNTALIEQDWPKLRDKMMSAILEHGDRKQESVFIELRDGTMLERKIIPLPDGNTLVTHVDITHAVLIQRSLEERNQALQAADRIKTEFLTNVSYELRSPLTSIIGITEILQREYFGTLNDKQREHLYNIASASKYLMNLINDILDLASIEAGYIKLDTSQFSIQNLISTLVPQIKLRTAEQQINFIVECDEEVGYMIGDANRIKQVIQKLIDNAIEFNKPGGYIKLSVSAVNQEQIIICVEDSGVGINESELEFIFSKFYRTKRRGMSVSGTGLGLSLIKSLIELHGGQVELSSQEGVGTKIICILSRSKNYLNVKNEEDNNISLVLDHI